MLFWILGASLSTSREIFTGAVLKFKTGLHWENYAAAWNNQNVSVFFGNSLLYATIASAGVLVISAPAAYERGHVALAAVTYAQCPMDKCLYWNIYRILYLGNLLQAQLPCQNKPAESQRLQELCLLNGSYVCLG